MPTLGVPERVRTSSPYRFLIAAQTRVNHLAVQDAVSTLNSLTLCGQRRSVPWRKLALSRHEQTTLCALCAEVYNKRLQQQARP